MTERRLKRKSAKQNQPEKSTKVTTECPTCYDCVTEDQIISCEGCIYRACTICWKNWILKQETPSLFLQTPCMNLCGKILTHPQIKSLVGDAKFDQMGVKSVSQGGRGSDLYQCPIPDCEYVGYWGGALIEDTYPPEICDLCQQSRCILCGVIPFHAGLGCEEAAQTTIPAPSFILPKNMKIATCPGCRISIEKVSRTCNKMQCGCGTRFCFLFFWLSGSLQTYARI